MVIATIALFLLINSAMQRSAHALSGQRMAAQSAIVGAVLEYVQGMGVVRAFSMTATPSGSCRAPSPNASA